MNRKILFVDDETNILAGFERILRRNFEVVTSTSGDEGLVSLKERGPFAVVVSDFSMPAMNGVTFLSLCKENAPDTVRMMLTGQADFKDAIQAVNEGNIFRFLLKPCPFDLLTKALEAGVRQFELVMTERELLEKTLKASIKVLVEILSMTNPEAFSRTSRICGWMRRVALRLKMENLVEVDLAGMLSQIGCVAIPQQILVKKFSGELLSKNELALLNNHPQVGRKLLSAIPRLEHIAEIIGYQLKPFSGEDTPDDTMKREKIPLVSRLLKTVLDFDDYMQRGLLLETVIQKLQENASRYDPQILVILAEEARLAQPGLVLKSLKVAELSPGMIVAEPVHDARGTLLVNKGQEVSTIIIQRLLSYLEFGYLKGPIQVLVRK